VRLMHDHEVVAEDLHQRLIHQPLA
jgi:hypothetical protein